MDKIASMNQSDAWCMIRRRAKPAGIAADVDRLVHHATIFEMNVESYRRRSTLERKRGGDGRGLRLEVPPAANDPGGKAPPDVGPRTQRLTVPVFAAAPGSGSPSDSCRAKPNSHRRDAT